MLRYVIAVGFLIGIAPTDALAVHTVTVCGETCSSGEQCNLGNNLSCNATAVTLNSGADFDFKGYTITCSGCPSTNAVAVQVNAANSTVEDSVGGGGTRGAWPAAVNCNGQTASLVRKVKIDGASWGINGCRKVEHNVLTDIGNSGILNWSMGNSDYINDNYIIGGEKGIWVEGAGSGEIDHNVLVNQSPWMLLLQYTSASLVVTGNMFFSYADDGIPIYFGTKPIVAGNICGDPTLSNCDYCIDEALCQGPTTPYVGP